MINTGLAGLGSWLGEMEEGLDIKSMFGVFVFTRLECFLHMHWHFPELHHSTTATPQGCMIMWRRGSRGGM